MQSEERTNVVKLLRSVLIASKSGVPLETINREYKGIVGEYIPFRRLGYTTLEDFLDQSPDLCRITYTNNGIMIHGLATEETAHIKDMVSRQRSQGKKARPTKPPARRPMNNMRPWQPPTPSQPFRGQPYNRFMASGRGNNAAMRPGGSGRFPAQRSPQSQMQYQQMQRLRTPNYSTSSNNQVQQPVLAANNGMLNNSHMNNNRGGQRSQHVQHVQVKQQQQQPRGQNNYQQQKQQQNVTTPPKSNNYSMISSVTLLERYFSQNNLGELAFKTAPIGGNVKNNNVGGGNNGGKNGAGAKKVIRFVSTIKVGDQSFQTFPNSYNTKELAEEAAASIAVAKLNISEASTNNNVSTSSVMSMPIGVFGAPEMTAKIGLTEKASEDLDDVLVDRIVHLVGKRSNGVWSTQIDVEYKRQYSKALPDNWPDKAEASDEACKKLRVERPLEGRYIIYPVLQPDSTATAELAALSITQPKVEPKRQLEQQVPGEKPSTTKSKKLPSSVPSQKRPPKLILPEDPHWDVYVTCVHSTINVCLRVLGDNFSTKFDDMVTNMELKYFETDSVPLNKELVVANPEVGKLYAAKVEGDWHRVEVTNVHGLEVTCYFIDHGDEDVLNVKDLRQLLSEFLDLAPQAKSVRLAGLEDLAGDATAQAELTNAALGRSLVGQVHARDEAGISLILYDTSNSDEDLNINEKILDKFRPNNGVFKNGSSSESSRITSPAPQPPVLEVPSMSGDDKSTVMKDLLSMDLASLKPLMPTTVPEVGEFLDVNITLAASPSNFTVQPWQNTTQLESFQAELNSFYSDSGNAYFRALTNSDISNGDKFYAGHHMDGKWYRVKVNATIDETTVAAKIVDFGDFTMIPLERLQPLWPQFRNLPMQAVNANLADIVATNGDWTAEDTIWFSERVVNNQFVTKIRDVTYDPLDDNVRISVSLIDTTHPTTDIYIEKQLVDEKRAVYLCV